ncbi:AAA family ATPase [Furfurilactobacillus entadae]|uniref:AAA family ATPase n=1 Tax=Furfurilactobacillus entadae TaxID=2922307 RepID=UPI0035EE8BA0
MALSYQELLTAIPVVLRAGHVPNIVGEAGIGKSAVVAEVAETLHAKLFTTVVSLSEKGDLAIPIPPLTTASYIQTKLYGQLADVQFGYAHTLIAIIKFAEAHPGQPIIWLLDEFNRGTQAVQSELMNLVLQRQINDLTLPDEVQLILAENPDAQMAGFEQTFYGVTAGDDAIKDRTTRLEMRVAVADWLTWANEDNGHGEPNIMPQIQAYLTDHPTELQPNVHDTDLYPTPRAWQRVSDNLRQLARLPETQQDALRFDLITGDLGITVGAKLTAFLRQGLTVADVYTALGEPALPATVHTAVQKLALGERQALVIAAGMSATYPLTVTENALRWQELLRTLPADGQYAVIHTLGNHSGWLARLQQTTGASDLAQYVVQILNGQIVR